MIMRDLVLCNRVFDAEDTKMLLKSLSATYDEKSDLISISCEDGDIALSTEDFESALDNWFQIGPTLATFIVHLSRIVNNTDNEAGDFVQYIKDFAKE